MMPVVFSGSANRALAEAVAVELGVFLGACDSAQAADGQEADIALVVGPAAAKRIMRFLKGAENRRAIWQCLERGLRPHLAGSAKRSGRGTFRDKTVVFTGGLSRMAREEAEELVRAQGGTAASSITRGTDIVIVGERPGEKVGRARSLGIPTVTEREFLRRAGRSTIDRERR